MAVDVLIGLSTVPSVLVHLQVDDLPKISMITASKSCIRGAVNGIRCSSKGEYKSKQCA